MIQNYNITKRLSGIAKNAFKIPVIWGGIQPILQPKECINEPEIDFICTGEGEYAFTELLEKIENNQNTTNIAGIWSKTADGKIMRTGRPNLIENLDALPYPDRDLLELKYYQAELTGANILTARGCPFPCAYCQNEKLMEIYKNKGKFVRYRNLENILKEMEEIIKKYDAPSFYISDEIFTLNKTRAIEFCREYKKRIKKPFMVQTRVDYMDKELAGELSEAGCFMVNMAIENGNENVRNTILNKKISNEHILNAYESVHENRMMTTSFNMIGAPGETINTIWDTIKINRELKPSRILCTIFMPLPGTKLWDHCRRNNLIDKDIAETTNYYSQVAIKNPKISPQDLIGYQGFFDWYVLLPTWSYWIIHIMRKLYQTMVSPKVPKNPLKRKLRENMIEMVYQSKKFLPWKKLHIKNR